jgi:hypothetical protein
VLFLVPNRNLTFPLPSKPRFSDERKGFDVIHRRVELRFANPTYLALSSLVLCSYVKMHNWYSKKENKCPKKKLF